MPRTQMTHRLTSLVTSALVMVLSGCGGRGAGSQPTQALSPEYAGPRADQPEPASTPQANPDQAPVETVAASPETSATQGGDSRPEWWFEGVLAQDGAIQVCAEALASDLQDARRQAVDAGRARLAQAIDGADEQALRTRMRIEQTSVRPLPETRGGTFRYVAYVMVSLAPEE